MFDTMTLTKIVGGICGTFLIFLFANWGAETIYSMGGGGHGDEHAQAYVIDTGEDESGAAEEEVVEVAFADVLATADAGKGERVFGKCKACHKLDGSNGTGPHLDGVVDRDIAAVGDFSYSDALTGLEGAWDAEALNGFLTNPKDYAPGTKMSFAGLKKIEDRANLVAYLATVQ
ncbi:c-type cytochrome [Celeribacter sp.]|uniref:c-type cytochrome n=1 Tax=Celeribacter sp. TaxID=1890673 RepID=UPI003A929674